MWRKIVNVLLIGVLLTITANIRAIEISLDPLVSHWKDRYGLYLNGEIKKQDYTKLLVAIAARGEFPDRVSINSIGGDVMEAMRIGRLLRNGLVETLAVGTCNSACLFVLVGGTVRNAISTIGVHRPKFNEEYFSGLSANEARKKYKELQKLTKDYLVEMDIPENTTELMFKTPSSTMHFIVEARPGMEEQFEKTVGQNPPAYEEWIAAKCGRLTQDEKDDIAVLFEQWQLKALLKYGSSGTGGWREKDLKKVEATISQMSPGYIEYLKMKSEKIHECKKSAKKEERVKLLKQELAEVNQNELNAYVFNGERVMPRRGKSIDTTSVNDE